jgi:hypothetical protein
MFRNLESINLIIDFGNIVKIKASLARFLAPRTIENIVKQLPLSSRAFREKNCIRIPIRIKTGLEKPGKLNFNMGDIAYCPLGSDIILFLNEDSSYAKSLLIGYITEGLDKLMEIPKSIPVHIKMLD